MDNRKIFQYVKRVKTRLWSIMSKDRLSGMCMMDDHREKINLNENTFIEDVINKFGIKRRNLQFLFSGNET